MDLFRKELPTLTGDPFRAFADLEEEKCTLYPQSNTVERHSYREGRIMIWARILLGAHTDLHVSHRGTLTDVRYRDENLDLHVRPYSGAIRYDFILMDDNSLPH
ncbi:uncharacterized protein TNCV_121961 [Trichonephila clavipes]|nr:uncharacterized protein TNCV_121961 [Trichonephila clavipes]